MSSKVPTDTELQANADARGAVFVNESKLAASIKSVEFMVHPGSQLTICVVTMLNGYVVTGESACADPKMFDKEVGEKFAFAAAERKVWPLLGYALKDELFKKLGENATFLDRMENEEWELRDRIAKLSAFIDGNVQFSRLTEEQRTDMLDQLTHMQGYWFVLDKRIKNAKA